MLVLYREYIAFIDHNNRFVCIEVKLILLKYLIDCTIVATVISDLLSNVFINVS